MSIHTFGSEISVKRFLEETRDITGDPVTLAISKANHVQPEWVPVYGYPGVRLRFLTGLWDVEVRH